MTTSQLLVSVFNKTAAKIIIKVDDLTVKGSFGNGTFKSVTLNRRTDTFDIHRYRVIGVEVKTEKRLNDVLADNLLEAVKAN